MAKDSFGARTTLSVDGKKYEIHKLEALERRGFNLSRMPYSIKVMLENVVRREDGMVVTTEQVETVARWSPKPPEREFSFMPARVLLAGLHRRAGGGRPGRDARCGQAAGRQSRPRSIHSSPPTW